MERDNPFLPQQYPKAPKLNLFGGMADAFSSSFGGLMGSMGSGPAPSWGQKLDQSGMSSPTFGGSGGGPPRFTPTPAPPTTSYMGSTINPQDGLDRTSAGTVGSLGGDWAQLDSANGLIQKAASKYGVPANLVKAMIYNESQGYWDRDGNRFPYIAGQWNDNILPYVGIFAGVAREWGYDPQQLIGNQELQIDAMANGLSRIYHQVGSWEGAITYYFSGHATPTGWSDGNMTDQQYLDKTLNNINALGGISETSPGTVGGGSIGQMSSIWGGSDAPVTFEFGAEGGRDLYGYGALSGLNGTEHTGIDIGVPRGTPLYSPGAGTVSCVGWGDAGIGGTGGGTCGYFEDQDGGGVGNITIRLDNGTFVVLGHSSVANVKPGDRVSAGQLVGQSGGEFGAHVHVETRVPDSSTQSGYRIVDPRTVLGGMQQVGGAVNGQHVSTSGPYADFWARVQGGPQYQATGPSGHVAYGPSGQPRFIR